MLANRVFYLSALIGASAYFIRSDGWLAAYLGIAVLAAPLLSLLCTLIHLRRLGRGAVIEFDERQIDCEQGDAVILTGNAAGGRDFCLPFFLRAAVEYRMSGRVVRDRLILEPGTFSEFLPVDTEHCGCVEYRIICCQICDFLGLFRLPVRKPEKCVIYIRPNPVRPEPEPDFTVFRQNRYRPKPGGGNAEIHEIRSYRPGDPVSQIHWKLSAKRDEPMIREPQEAAELSAEAVLETPDDRDALDRILREAQWTGNEMTERGIAGSLGWLGMTACPVTDEESFSRAMEALLRTRIADFPCPNERAAFLPGRIVLTGEDKGGGVA